MRWLPDLMSRREPLPQDVAERFSKAGMFRVTMERVAVTDVDTVRRWLRELDSRSGHQVHIRRPWGVLVALGDGRHPVDVVLADDEDRSWSAHPPGGSEDLSLTPEQVEYVMLDALSSTERPAWPGWRRLI